MTEITISPLRERLERYRESDLWKEAFPSLEKRLQRHSLRQIYESCERELEAGVIGRMWLRYYMNPERAVIEIGRRNPTEWDYEDFCYCICVMQHVEAQEALNGKGKGKEDREPAARRSARQPKPRVTSSTYRYRWYDTHLPRIITLYQLLTRRGLIARDTNHEDFEALFSGAESTGRIKWLAPQAWLWYMLREMERRQYIGMEEGQSIWVVASSHFVDRDGRLFSNVSFSKCKEPRKALCALDRLVEILDVRVDAPQIAMMDDDPDAELWAGIRDRGI